MNVPEYPFFHPERPEVAFGATAARYLRVSKHEASEIMDHLPEETQMAKIWARRAGNGRDDEYVTVPYLTFPARSPNP